MTDTFRKVNDGDPLKIPAASWNAAMDAAKDFANRSRSIGADSLRGPLGPGQIIVQNNSGDDLAHGSVLALGAPLILPADNENEFVFGAPAFAGDTPSEADAGRFCVLAEPIGNGRLGRAWVDGVFPAWISGAVSVGQCVDVVDGENEFLSFLKAGAVRVVWCEAGTGERWARIRMADRNGTEPDRVGRVLTDWGPYETVSVKVISGGVLTDETVDCIAPGTDGEDMACCRGRIVRTDGNEPVLYEFQPTECKPSATDCGGS